MGRNCNLELRLVTPSPSSDTYDNSLPSMINGGLNENEDIQKLTIFYQGRIAAFDVTELQARAILLMASRKMEEERSRRNSPCGPGSPSSPLLVQSPSQLYGSQSAALSGALSMKRSLQHFLQKRRTRSRAAASPYHR